MFWKREKTLLDKEIERAVLDLRVHEIGSNQYLKTVDTLVKLNEMKYKQTSPVSRDTLAIVFGNLIGILMILGHEHLNPITSKAMSILLKPRI